MTDQRHWLSLVCRRNDEGLWMIDIYDLLGCYHPGKDKVIENHLSESLYTLVQGRVRHVVVDLQHDHTTCGIWSVALCPLIAEPDFDIVDKDAVIDELDVLTSKYSEYLYGSTAVILEKE